MRTEENDSISNVVPCFLNKGNKFIINGTCNTVCVFDAQYCSVKLMYFQKLRFTTNYINKRIELEEDEYICKLTRKQHT